MKWNHRVVKRTFYKYGKRYNYYYIAEAYYYNDDTSKTPDAITDQIAPTGETMDECRGTYLMMASAFLKPVIKYEDVVPKERKK